jgi:hypothetical protein
MPILTPTTAPVLWQVATEVGLTRIGEATVSGQAFTTAENEANFLAAVGPTVYAELVERLAYPTWNPYIVAVTSPSPTIVWWQDRLWECIEPHTGAGDMNWQPGVAVSLWKRFFVPNELPAWTQPVGSVDAWPLGAKVLHNGHTWKSLIPANVQEPGSDPRWWECLDCEPVVGEWVSGEQITFDPANPAQRTYQGNIYQLRQSPGINIWPPPSVPALWLLIGPVP